MDDCQMTSGRVLDFPPGFEIANRSGSPLVKNGGGHATGSKRCAGRR